MIGAGQQIGSYTVLHPLGRGGMGEVYLAQHRRVARRAAIKVLVPELSQNAVVLDRFFNEARAASLIRHPGIVEILDCDLYLGQAYIVMELLEGESFGEYLHRTGPLDGDPSFFYGVSAAVASAVGAAHATGIIHRDLKPDNIFLHLPAPAQPVVAVKILDFGIAKLAQQDGAHSQTGTGVLLGTPAYMSPEQCRGAGRVDSRSDIYSLGCILYEALSGGPPFVREGFGDLIVAHVSEPPAPLSPRVPGVAPELESLILSMLAKAPEQRPQTMEEVVIALQACARAADVSLDAPLRAKSAVRRPPEKLESAVTQPAVVAGRPSTNATTPLGPTAPRGGGEAGSGPVVASTVPSDGTGRAGSEPSGRGLAPSGSESSRSASAVPSAPGFAAGSTRVLAETADPRPAGSRRSTTFSSTAAESVAKPRRASGRWAAVGGGAALAIVGAVVIVGLRPSTSPTASSSPSLSTPAGPRAEAVAPAVPPTSADPRPPATTATQDQPVPPALAAEGKPAPSPDTVRIDLRGAPPETTAEVDGRPAALPLELPRGPRIHRITLQAPGVPPRTLDIDGTRDRIVDMIIAPVAATAAAAKKVPAATGAPGGPDGHTTRDANHRSPGGARERGRTPDRAAAGAGDNKTPAGQSDREAITDI